MASAFLGRHLSIDKVVVTVVATGCLAVLVDANQTGRAPLFAEIPACQCPRPTAIPSLTNMQCQKLSNNGFLVVDNFLTRQQIRDARHDIQQLDSIGKFQSSPNEDEQETLVRTDRIYICRDSQGGLAQIRNCLSQFARGLTDSDFVGFDNNYQSNHLQVPAQMQVSIYGGKGLPASYNFYNSHLDSAGAHNFMELGLLGWLRSQYLRKRYVTCIVYLNDDWKEGDGGCLRLHKKATPAGTLDNDNYIDVPPLAGRLVVLSSLYQWHAVLPTSATRYACSLWLTLS